MPDKNAIRQLISQNHLREALEAMTADYPDAAVLLSKLTAVQREKNMGTISFDEWTRAQNQVAAAALSLLNDDPTAAPPGAGTPTRQAGVSPQLPWILGLVLLVGTAIALIGIVPCPSANAERLFRLLMALGAGLIGTIVPGIFDLNFKGVKATSAAGFFALVYLINPAGVMKNDSRCKDFATVTVVVHGAAGPHQKILRSQGEVVIEFDRTEKARINENGEAVFVKIPAQWLEEKVKIYLEHPQPYQVLHPDSLYQIKADGKVYVAAALQNADRLFGTITDAQNGAFLDSVRVSIRNIAAYTDANGWFELEIPADIQQKFQRVTLSRKGYKVAVYDSIPVHTQREFSQSLYPK